MYFPALTHMLRPWQQVIEFRNNLKIFWNVLLSRQPEDLSLQRFMYLVSGLFLCFPSVSHVYPENIVIIDV